MDHQATPMSSAANPIQGVTDKLRMFVITILDLASLQSQLVVEDSQEAQRYLKAAGVAMAVALAMLVTAMPLIGLGVVEWLVQQGWQRAIASLGFGSVLALVAGGLTWFAWRSSTRAAQSFANSRREMLANLAWFRDSMEHPKHDELSKKSGAHYE